MEESSKLTRLKKEFLELLEKDVEFRYTVAGYLGLSEILKRLDMLAEEQAKVWGEISKVWSEIRGLREEQARLREDMLEGFRRHDEEIKGLREEQARFRQDMLEGFRRHSEILEKHSEILERHGEILEKHGEILEKHGEILERHGEEIAKLREDMLEGFDLVRRHIDALGSRWGLMTEEAFRDGIKGLLEEEFGFKIEKWVRYDESGIVFGYPSDVDVDVAVSDGRLILLEVASHIRSSDVYEFKRKAEFYVEKTGRKPDRLMMVTPYADRKALEAAARFGIEIYTGV